MSEKPAETAGIAEPPGSGNVKFTQGLKINPIQTRGGGGGGAFGARANFEDL